MQHTNLMARCLFIVIALTIVPVASDAEERYRNNSYGFELTLPPGWSLEAENRAALGLAASFRKIPNQLPTCNIIAAAGGTDVAATPTAQLENSIRDSYWSMGLTDAVVQSSALETFNGQHVFVATLLYSAGGERLSSLVGLVPARTRHFYLTCIAEQAEFGDSIGEFRELLASFTVDEPARPATSERTSKVWLWLLLGVFAVAAGYVVWRFKRERSI